MKTQWHGDAMDTPLVTWPLDSVEACRKAAYYAEEEVADIVRRDGKITDAGIMRVMGCDVPDTAMGSVRFALERSRAYILAKEEWYAKQDKRELARQYVESELLSAISGAEKDADRLKALSLYMDMHGLKIKSQDIKIEVESDMSLAERLERASKALAGK